MTAPANKKARPSVIAVEILGVDISIEIQEARLAETASPLFTLYPLSSKGPDVEYRIDSLSDLRVFKNNECIYQAHHRDDLLPALQSDLHQTVLAAQKQCWILHAAAVALEKHVMVLAGHSGAGKSTLSAALVLRGAKYFSDDCTVIQQDGSVSGLSRPITFSWQRAQKRSHEHLASSRYRILHRDQTYKELLLLHPPVENRADQPGKLTTLVKIDQAKGLSQPKIKKLTSTQALQALWPCSLRTNHESLQVAMSLLEDFPVWSVTTSTVEQALSAMDTLQRDPSFQTSK